MKLRGIRVLSGKIRLRSGLHIGAGGAEVQIGPDGQRRLAGSLKTYYERHDKWSSKQCFPKQWKKAQKIRSILGEP